MAEKILSELTSADELTGDQGELMPFTVNPELSADDCYDAATLRMEQVQQLIDLTIKAYGEDVPTVLGPMESLLREARAAYAAAFDRIVAAR